MKLLREPLLHFLLLGTAIFAAHAIFSGDTRKADEIIITQGKIENIITTFSRTWQRPPTEQELQGLIRDYVREEVAYREAKAMGLDQDDTIVRRRLRQKLEFVSEDVAAMVQPTELQLQSYLRSHPEQFKTEPTFTFLQVYLNPQKHGSGLKRDTEQMLATLRQTGAQADLFSLGDTSLLDAHFENVTTSDVKRMFGDEFAAGLSKLTPGQWQGPLESGYGTHLVFIVERVQGHTPALDEVRDQVQREWENTRRQEVKEKFYQGLLQRYTVRIESPEEKKIAEKRP